jgi:hypothetical protein
MEAVAHETAVLDDFDCQDRLHSFKVCQFEASEQSGVVNIEGKWEWSKRV